MNREYLYWTFRAWADMQLIPMKRFRDDDFLSEPLGEVIGSK